MKFVLVINSKMPTTVGILEFIIRTDYINIGCGSEQENCSVCLCFEIFEDLIINFMLMSVEQFHLQLQ